MAFVDHNGTHVATTEDVLIRLGLKPGQPISENTLFDVIAANAGNFCQHMEARQERGLPAVDTSMLAASLRR